MPLWIVFYIAGNMVGSVGPVVFDMEECRTRVSEWQAKVRSDIVLDGGFSLKELEFKCEYHYERPTSRNGVK